MNRELPTGTVTFLFSDIEGSTRLAQALGTDRWRTVLEAHQQIWRAVFVAHRGIEVSTEGDSFFAVFPSAVDALNAAIAAQRGMAAADWPEEAGSDGLRVRVGLHTGEGTRGGDSYVGLDVHRAARIAAAGNGGQTIVSATTRSLAGGSLPPGVGLIDVGRHRLKDLAEPEALWRVVIPGLADSARPIRSLESPTNLPLDLTSFVGRDRETAEVVEVARTARLVTLTGPGGTGKTRLALAAAAVLLADFPDGVYFVELASITDPAFVATSILTTLGIKDEATTDREQLLREHLRDRRALLVLDNFEQIVAAAPLIGRLLGAAPALHVLVSSREVLHLRGEQEFPVLPLGLPDSKARGLGVADLAGSEAVALFVDRARTVVPGFVLDPGNAAAIGEIVASLDGLPLAIELAAARVKILGPTAIRDRLRQNYDILASSERDIPERQRTLRGAIAWSCDLLDPVERAFLARAAIFVGGWTLEAASEVCELSGDLSRDVVDVIASLVDKSLVRTDPTAEGEPRFRYLATIREFALEQLVETGQQATLARRHAQYFATFAEAMAPRLASQEVVRSVDRMGLDHDNLRAAVGWSVAAGEPGPGLRIMGWAWRFWYLGGHLVEGRSALEELLGQPNSAHPTQDRAIGLNGAGGIAYWLGDFDAARRSWSEALAINEALADQAGLAEGHYNLGFISMIKGETAASRAHFAAAMRIYEALGDEIGIIFAREAIVPALIHEGDLAGAEGILGDVVVQQRARGDLVRVSEDLSLLAAAQVTSGKIERARESASEAVRLLAEVGTLTTLGTGLASVAMVAVAIGRPNRAATIAGALDNLIETTHVVVPQVAMLGMPSATDLAGPLLDPATFDRNYAEGRTMTRAAIVAFALESLAPAPDPPPS